MSKCPHIYATVDNEEPECAIELAPDQSFRCAICDLAFSESTRAGAAVGGEMSELTLQYVIERLNIAAAKDDGEGYLVSAPMTGKLAALFERLEREQIEQGSKLDKALEENKLLHVTLTAEVDHHKRVCEQYDALQSRLDKFVQQAVITTSQGGCCRICERAWITEEPDHLHWCVLNARDVERRVRIISNADLDGSGDDPRLPHNQPPE